MTTELVTNLEDKQRAKCAGVDFLLRVCEHCKTPFTPWRRDQVTCGEVSCRTGQHKKRVEQHEAFVERQWARRRGKSMVDLIAQTRGPNVRDHYKEANKLVIDKTQVFSRCKQCGKDFTDANDKPITSSFEFCGETLLKQGDCKQQWLDAKAVVAPKVIKVAVRQPLDEERNAQTMRVHAPKIVKMGRRKLNFCPQCREYVNQDHEHQQ